METAAPNPLPSPEVGKEAAPKEGKEKRQYIKSGKYKKKKVRSRILRILPDEGEGIFVCGNCKSFKEKFKHNERGRESLKSCEDYGISSKAKPCAWNQRNPLFYWNPIDTGDLFVPENLSYADIQGLKYLLLKMEKDIVNKRYYDPDLNVGHVYKFKHDGKLYLGTLEKFTRSFRRERILKMKVLEISGETTYHHIKVGDIVKDP